MPSNLPSYSVDMQDHSDTKENLCVWYDEKNNLRVCVKYYSSGNPPEAVLEKFKGKDALNNELWLEVKDKDEFFNCKDALLRGLAYASTDDEEDVLSN